MSEQIDTPPEKNLGGRPRKLQPDGKTLTLVKGLSQMLATGPEIAAVLGVSKRTWIRFKKEFPEVDLALRQGQALFRVALRRRQFKAADDGNPTMLIWLGKQYLGQADKPQGTGKDGGPIQSLDLTKVSADDLETSSRSLVRLPDPATMMRLIRAEKAKRAAEEERARVAKDAERIREVARRLPASLARPGTSWSRTRRWSGTGISTRSARTSSRVTDGQRSIASSPVVGQRAARAGLSVRQVGIVPFRHSLRQRLASRHVAFLQTRDQENRGVAYVLPKVASANH